jgi:hypothetical protein
VLHLNGNVRQWLVSSFNQKKTSAIAPPNSPPAGKFLAPRFSKNSNWTITEAANVLDRLTEADLIARYEIQGYHVYGLEAVYQVIEHFGLHYGQIAYITKMLKDQDLGFYNELNKTGRASG